MTAVVDIGTPRPGQRACFQSYRGDLLRYFWSLILNVLLSYCRFIIRIMASQCQKIGFWFLLHHSIPWGDWVIYLIRHRIETQLIRRSVLARSLMPRNHLNVWWIEHITDTSCVNRSRNTLLAAALRDEEWVLWMDVDLHMWLLYHRSDMIVLLYLDWMKTHLYRYPKDIIHQLLSAHKSIVVPNVVMRYIYSRFSC